MGNVQAESEIYLPEHRFRVRVDGEEYGEFSEASGINDFEIKVAEINTGESNVVASQSATKKVYQPLVLTKGASRNRKLIDWADLVVDASGRNGTVDPGYKKIVEVSQLDRDGTPVITWTYHEAWPSKVSEGKFDAKSGEFRMESVTITFRYNTSGPAEG